MGSRSKEPEIDRENRMLNGIVLNEDGVDTRQYADHAPHKQKTPVKKPLMVEIVSEGPHCVPCEYAIAAVEYVSESYEGLICVRVLETKRPVDARRYLKLCKEHGGRLPIPAILFAGRLVFDQIPGPDELRLALDQALHDWGKKK